MPETVTLYEVGPRDGLQNEKRMLATDQKVKLVDQLSLCGLPKIEVTSFVSSKWVPQMADAGPILDRIERRPGIVYSALTPNLNGLEKALRHGVDEVAVFAAASEAFSQKNINCSIDESIMRFAPVVERAAAEGIAVRGYVSTIVDCPFSGLVAPDQVTNVAEKLLGLGCYEISLGDTTGGGRPNDVETLLDHLSQHLPVARLAGHFHDTTGTALANIGVCLTKGIRTFDASIAGLGGCPFAPGAKGNVATEAVCEFVEGLGFTTGIDRGRLEQVARFAREITR